MDGGDLTDFLNWTALEPLFCTSQEPEGGDADLTDTLGLQCGGAWLQKSGLSSLMGTSEYLGGPEPCGDEFVLRSPHGPSLPIYVSDACFSPRLARERGVSRKAVVLGLDETGFAEAEGAAPNAGTRLRAIADRVAVALDAVVVVPDFLRGDGWTEAKQGAATFNDEDARRAWYARVGDPAGLAFDLDQVVLPFLRSDKGVRGPRSVSVVGFGFGGCVAFVAARFDWCACVAAAHATLGVFRFHGSSPVDAARKVRCPAMLLQSGGDPDETKRGGAVHRALDEAPFAAACDVDDYPRMAHGFVLHGDPTAPDVARDAELATARLIAFVKTHLDP